MQIPSFAYKVLALAPFSTEDGSPWTKAPLRIDETSLDRVIDELEPTCGISVPQELYPEGIFELKLKSLKAFHPDHLLQHNPVLRNIWEARSYIAEARKKELSHAEISSRLKQWSNLPPIQIDVEPKKSRPRAQRSLDKIFDMVATPDTSDGKPPAARDATDQLDFILREILKSIYLNESFRTLEASWRGLNLLLHQGGITNDLELEIVPASHDTLEETLDNLLTELIDDLPSLVLLDLPFDTSPRSLKLLEKLAHFSETLLVPTVTWITPGFFHLDAWDDLRKISFLPHYLEEPAFAKWQSIKTSTAARWLTMSCNRFLVRYAYGINNTPRLLQFDEPAQLWISPVWALGALICQSVARIGWPTRFTQWQEIRLEDLPLNPETPDNPLPTEADFTTDRIDQFIRSGIVPLTAMPGKDVAFAPSETTVSDLSLGFQLLVSRVTQLILWCRDTFHKDLEAHELESGLRQAFKLFWEKSGHMGPERLDISVGPPDSEGRIPLRIDLAPSRQVLPSQKKVELDFYW
jgi:hypothetical protein